MAIPGGDLQLLDRPIRIRLSRRQWMALPSRDKGLRTRRGNVVALGPYSSAAGEISRPALPSVAGVRVACGDPQGQPQRTQRPLSLSCHARRLKNNPTGEHPER